MKTIHARTSSTPPPHPHSARTSRLLQQRRLTDTRKSAPPPRSASPGPPSLSILTAAPSHVNEAQRIASAKSSRALSGAAGPAPSALDPDLSVVARHRSQPASRPMSRPSLSLLGRVLSRGRIVPGSGTPPIHTEAEFARSVAVSRAESRCGSTEGSTTWLGNVRGGHSLRQIKLSLMGAEGSTSFTASRGHRTGTEASAASHVADGTMSVSQFLSGVCLPTSQVEIQQALMAGGAKGAHNRSITHQKVPVLNLRPGLRRSGSIGQHLGGRPREEPAGIIARAQSIPGMWPPGAAPSAAADVGLPLAAPERASATPSPARASLISRRTPSFVAPLKVPDEAGAWAMTILSPMPPTPQEPNLVPPTPSLRDHRRDQLLLALKRPRPPPSAESLPKAGRLPPPPQPQVQPAVPGRTSRPSSPSALSTVSSAPKGLPPPPQMGARSSVPTDMSEAGPPTHATSAKKSREGPRKKRALGARSQGEDPCRHLSEGDSVPPQPTPLPRLKLSLGQRVKALFGCLGKKQTQGGGKGKR